MYISYLLDIQYVQGPTIIFFQWRGVFSLDLPFNGPHLNAHGQGYPHINIGGCPKIEFCYDRL